MARPTRVIVVAGTGTEVGKTFVGAAVAAELIAAGRSVCARKPAQSFAPGDETTDADLLGAATGEDPRVVCPPHRWYAVPMAPPMAAAALGQSRFTTDDLAAEVAASWPAGEIEIGLVETAGGAWSPQAGDGMHVGHLAEAAGADMVLLVADAGLGVINAVRGAVAALGTARPILVVLNRFDASDALHVANRDWLCNDDELDVVTTAAEAADALAVF
jgi:dethiobiotin synthetase